MNAVTTELCIYNRRQVQFIKHPSCKVRNETSVREISILRICFRSYTSLNGSIKNIGSITKCFNSIKIFYIIECYTIILFSFSCLSCCSNARNISIQRLIQHIKHATKVKFKLHIINSNLCLESLQVVHKRKNDNFKIFLCIKLYDAVNKVVVRNNKRCCYICKTIKNKIDHFHRKTYIFKICKHIIVNTCNQFFEFFITFAHSKCVFKCHKFIFFKLF